MKICAIRLIIIFINHKVSNLVLTVSWECIIIFKLSIYNPNPFNNVARALEKQRDFEHMSQKSCVAVRER